MLAVSERYSRIDTLILVKLLFWRLNLIYNRFDPGKSIVRNDAKVLFGQESGRLLERLARSVVKGHAILQGPYDVEQVPWTVGALFDEDGVMVTFCTKEAG